MAIRDIVTAGYGGWETDTRFIPTRGYTPAAGAAPSTVTLVVTARSASGDTAARKSEGDSVSRKGFPDDVSKRGGIA